MKRLNLPHASAIVALASLMAFGTQVVFALLMLHLFSPTEVGEFSLLSQIGFFWMTLALAQAPLRLLANAHISLGASLREAVHTSLQRGLCLLPLTLLALWFSDVPLWPAILWITLLALFQMGWMLAQSLTLRTTNPWHKALVRVLPPLTAASAAWVGATLQSTAPTLVLSAIGGYLVGAGFLVPLWVTTSDETPPTPIPEPAQADKRSTGLRLMHTLTDALLATALMVVWQRLYGAQETGWMSALLRVLGFVPALVHMAWAQVLLAERAATPSRSSPLTPGRLALGAFCAVALLAFFCAMALQQHWLDARWRGIGSYLVALALWQGCACLSAAFSHRPFQTGRAAHYSWACITLTATQASVLLAPLAWDTSWSASHHMLAYALTSAVGLIGLTSWMARLR